MKLFQDLYDFAGGILKSAKNQEYTVIRFIDSKFENFKLVKSDLSKTYVKDLDTINLKNRKDWNYKNYWKCSKSWKLYNFKQ